MDTCPAPFQKPNVYLSFSYQSKFAVNLDSSVLMSDELQSWWRQVSKPARRFSSRCCWTQGVGDNLPRQKKHFCSFKQLSQSAWQHWNISSVSPATATDSPTNRNPSVFWSWLHPDVCRPDNDENHMLQRVSYKPCWNCPFWRQRLSSFWHKRTPEGWTSSMWRMQQSQPNSRTERNSGSLWQ